MNNEPLMQCRKCKEFVEFWSYGLHAQSCGESIQERVNKIHHRMMNEIFAQVSWPIQKSLTATEILERQQEKFLYLFPKS